MGGRGNGLGMASEWGLTAERAAVGKLGYGDRDAWSETKLVVEGTSNTIYGLQANTAPTDWPDEQTSLPEGSAHLWEESWDDDDTSEDFAVMLK